MLRSRLSTEHHYAFKPSPCLKRVELPLNEQIFNTIGINQHNSEPISKKIATHRVAKLRQAKTYWVGS
ncbi:hypothetical protein ACRN9V_01085 [Shewanella baltica]|uniref:hypothetical protein n=1 Tax=Shewanella baltica TaxID=62322 RepID=UPI003D7C0A7E